MHIKIGWLVNNKLGTMCNIYKYSDDLTELFPKKQCFF